MKLWPEKWWPREAWWRDPDDPTDTYVPFGLPGPWHRRASRRWAARSRALIAEIDRG